MSHSACFLLVTGVTQTMNFKAEKLNTFLSLQVNIWTEKKSSVLLK